MLILKKEFFEQIVEHSRRELPDEACGILSGKDGRVEKVYQMINARASPENYEMDSKEQFKIMKEMRNSGLEMLGVYHSHVASEARPSPRDAELAFYPDASYLIVSLKDKNNPCVRSFKIVDGKIEEEELKIVEEL